MSSLKRSVKGDEREALALKKRKMEEGDILLKLPNEILQQILKDLSRKDVINLSLLSHNHRTLFHSILMSEVRCTWPQVNDFIKKFKHHSSVETISITADLEHEKVTNQSEWNVSFKEVLTKCVHLKEMKIELLKSARCLKYKDDFDEDLSNKVVKLSIKSHHGTSSGDCNGESMFELTQLQRFHNIKELKLDGFSLNRDVYYHPKVKEDLSDYHLRKLDGKLNRLKEIEMVNCQWDYPISLKDVFSPEYPLPEGINGNDSERCSPNKISLTYKNEASKFVESERFRMFIDTDYNKHFMFEINFLKNLRELELVVINSDYESNKFQYYYPRLNLINLKRIFYSENERGEIKKQSLLTNLTKLKLVGWRLWSGLELDKCFCITQEADLSYSMTHFELYIMRSGDYDLSGPDESDRDAARQHESRLRRIFPDLTKCVVGYVEDYDG